MTTWEDTKRTSAFRKLSARDQRWLDTIHAIAAKVRKPKRRRSRR